MPILQTLRINGHHQAMGSFFNVKVFKTNSPTNQRKVQSKNYFKYKIIPNKAQAAPKIYDRLVNSKSLNLFKPITNLKRPWEPCEDEENTVTMGAPIECYMGTKHPQLVRHKFYQDLAKGDLLVGEIISWRRNIYELKFICMDGGQARLVSNLSRAVKQSFFAKLIMDK